MGKAQGWASRVTGNLQGQVGQMKGKIVGDQGSSVRLSSSQLPASQRACMHSHAIWLPIVTGLYCYRAQQALVLGTILLELVQGMGPPTQGWVTHLTVTPTQASAIKCSQVNTHSLPAKVMHPPRQRLEM